MAKVPYETALIAGVGPDISASRASRSALGVVVGLAARDVEKLKGLADETGANTFAVCLQPSAVARLFLDSEREPGRSSSHGETGVFTCRKQRSPFP
jgi:hypothetical protein